MTTVIRQWPDPLFYLSTAGNANALEQLQKLVQSTKRDRTIHDAQTVDSNGDEQQDVLQGLSFGNLTQRHRYRLFYDHDNARILVQRNTGTDAAKVWSELLRLDASGNLTPAGNLSADALTSTAGGLTLGGTLDFNTFYMRNLDKNVGLLRTDSLLVHGAITAGSLSVAHSTSHKHGGSDEVASGTPGANIIPKANSSGNLADGWISSSSVLQHVGSAAEVDTGTGDTNLPLGSQLKGTVRGYTRQQYAATVQLTDAANISWDLDLGQSAYVVLGGNRTLSNPTNMRSGATEILFVYQDATGGRTLSYDSLYKWPSGVAPTIGTGSNDLTILAFVTDGTYMYGASQGPYLI